MELNKYTSIANIKDSIENGIFAGKLADFNDPFEYEGIKYHENYRVCCLTTSSKKMLMWAYYGNHKGCCLKFELEDNDAVRKVTYTKEFKDHKTMSEEEIVENLYTKGKEWEHEDEYRILYNSKKSHSDMWNLVDTKVFFKARVKEVIFGFKVDFKSQDVQEVLKYLAYINRTCAEQVVVSHLTLSNKDYRLIKHKEFNYLYEITNT